MRSAGFIALGIVAVMACGSSGNESDNVQFREAVIWCEEAAAHLETCCGNDFAPNAIACEHHFERQTGCGSTTTTDVEPAWTEAESKCLRSQSCDHIRAANICARAMAAGKARATEVSINDPSSGGSTASSTSSGSEGLPAVCP